MVEGPTEVVADETDNGVPDLPQGQVGVPSIRVVRRKVGFAGVGQAQVGAQHVDAGLTQIAGGGVVGEAGQSMHTAEPDRYGVVAELADCRGEAFGVQAGGLTQGAVLVDALAPLLPCSHYGHSGSSLTSSIRVSQT
ncbi:MULTISPECIES: hypothetical protein [unclassified Streptomyces]|uniref:hypothetical protein n=1 Tax=unclassified Streptomyces TaxID=2593676 RepID=UPI00225579F2|nr:MULTISPECIES: hypothetical protein [unclassified Streptomyces]MCX5443754.1 hypothetical protein [Streptomyces sp. NBC_00063]WUB90905.1 hypothetical protein OHO83_00370 [Streptomyces sp. NBC_00569]WUB99134.1 hypothetical protein OHO83_46520 [Streptomyces sp. NBC_00569]